MFGLRERRTESGAKGTFDRSLYERIRREALSAAYLFFQENRSNAWILIAGADVKYYFNQVSSEIPLSGEMEFSQITTLLELFGEQFNIELRRLIIQDRDNTIATLQQRLTEIHPSGVGKLPRANTPS